MTQAHKEALAEGRRAGRVVRRYLAALEEGYRQIPTEDLPNAIAAIQTDLSELSEQLRVTRDVMDQVALRSKQEHLQLQLGWLEEQRSGHSLEDQFVEVAAE